MKEGRNTFYKKKFLKNLNICWDKELVLSIIALILSAVALVGNFLL